MGRVESSKLKPFVNLELIKLILIMHKINDLQLKGQRVLIRVDYNVPIKDGLVTDDFRIRASLPTIKHCLNNGASVVIMSH